VNTRRRSVNIVPYCEDTKCDSMRHHRASLEGTVCNLTLYIIFVKDSWP